MVLAVSAAPSASVVAADGSTLPGVRVSVTGITPTSGNRLLRYWRQLVTGEWLETPVTDTTEGTTTASGVDWTCPGTPLDPSTPATPYVYGVSVRTISTGQFTFASGTLSALPDRPGVGPWLIHPSTPHLSLPVTLEADTGRARAALGSVLQPYGVRSPIVTASGARALRAGTLTLNVPRSLRSDLAGLLDDGRTLYLAQTCADAATDDGLLYLEDPSDDVIASTVVRVTARYQQVYPGRLSPPSVLSSSDPSQWWW